MTTLLKVFLAVLGGAVSTSVEAKGGTAAAAAGAAAGAILSSILGENTTDGRKLTWRGFLILLGLLAVVAFIGLLIFCFKDYKNYKEKNKRRSTVVMMPATGHCVIHSLK